MSPDHDDAADADAVADAVASATVAVGSVAVSPKLANVGVVASATAAVDGEAASAEPTLGGVVRVRLGVASTTTGVKVGLSLLNCRSLFKNEKSLQIQLRRSCTARFPDSLLGKFQRKYTYATLHFYYNVFSGNGPSVNHLPHKTYKKGCLV